MTNSTTNIIIKNQLCFHCLCSGQSKCDGMKTYYKLCFVFYVMKLAQIMLKDQVTSFLYSLKVSCHDNKKSNTILPIFYFSVIFKRNANIVQFYKAVTKSDNNLVYKCH